MNLTRAVGAAQAPGMRGYGQFCPVALGAEMFAERWTPLILRELLAGSQRSHAPVIFQPGGSTGWHVRPGPALVTVKTGQLTLHQDLRRRPDVPGGGRR